jgi:hypothetical protein
MPRFLPTEKYRIIQWQLVVAKESGNFPKNAYVGPYWLVRDDSGRVLLMAHRCTLAEAEEYGEFLTCPHGHYDLWEGWRAACPMENVVGVLADSEYEEWPRGRVVFNAVHGQFIVYADQQISEDDLPRVLEHFGVPEGCVVFMRDSHYRRTRPLHPDSGRVQC